MNQEFLSLVVSITSIVLGVLAIALSIIFYKFSMDSSNKMKEASDQISSSISRLEALFNHLYDDTFSIMRDTVSDMRKHMWHEDDIPSDTIEKEIEKKTKSQLETIQRDLEMEVNRLLANQINTDSRLKQVQGQLSSIVEKAINESINIETKVRHEVTQSQILNTITELNDKNIVPTPRSISARLQINMGDIVPVLFEMARRKLIEWSEEHYNRLSSDDEIQIIKH